MPNGFLSESEISVLLVSPYSEDHASLRSAFLRSRWDLKTATTANQGLNIIRRDYRQLPVVIWEHSLRDCDWRMLLTEIDAMEVRPKLIIASVGADERLWAEVLNLGAFDVLLGSPFEPEEVLRVVESAWNAWQRDAGGSSSDLQAQSSMFDVSADSPRDAIPYRVSI